jgi:hypothetical protein
MAKRELDLSGNHALQSMTEWLRKKSGALLVCVVRVDDLAISADPQLAPRDSQNLLEDRMPALHDRLQEERKKARELADRKRLRAEKRIA